MHGLLAVTYTPTKECSLVLRLQTAVLDLGTKPCVRMRTEVENGILRNVQQLHCGVSSLLFG